MDERALPSGERGPVDLRALRRLASICFLLTMALRIAWGQREGRVARMQVNEKMGNVVGRFLRMIEYLRWLRFLSCCF